MTGPPVHGPAQMSRVMLIGQAPGPREGALGRPFAWTAGRTLFRWFATATGVDEESFRRGVYIAAIARCFPGKAANKGDRVPDREEIDRCQRFVSREVKIVAPELILPVGKLAIEQILGFKGPLAEVIGLQHRTTYHGVSTDVICLPHPSGVSTWTHTPPGNFLLARSLELVARHPAFAAIARGPAPAATG
jgi:uracil-DNA glycosylase